MFLLAILSEFGDKDLRRLPLREGRDAKRETRGRSQTPDLAFWFRFDDESSILDIKAGDDQGRLHNVEMQMVASAPLPQRFLDWWSQLDGSQLARGDDHTNKS